MQFVQWHLLNGLWQRIHHVWCFYYWKYLLKLHCSEISVESVDIHVSCIVSLFCGSTSVELTLLDVVVVLMVWLGFFTGFVHFIWGNFQDGAGMVHGHGPVVIAIIITSHISIIIIVVIVVIMLLCVSLPPSFFLCQPNQSRQMAAWFCLRFPHVKREFFLSAVTKCCSWRKNKEYSLDLLYVRNALR